MIIPPTPVPSPGGKGGGLRFRHVKVYWVCLKLEIPFLFMSVSIYAFFFIFTSKLRAYVILLFNLPTLNKTYLIWMIIFVKIHRFRQFFCNNVQKMINKSRFSYNHINNTNNYLKRRLWLLFFMSICTSLRLGKEQW